MKNLLLSLLVIFGITSCSKDSLDAIPENLQLNKSEIMVVVSFMHWTDQCEFSCGNTGGETLSYITNAKVELYSGEQPGSDVTGTPIMSAKTNDEGSAIMKEIDPATYTILIDTPLGKKSRTVTTQLHKRSYIDFSF